MDFKRGVDIIGTYDNGCYLNPNSKLIILEGNGRNIEYLNIWCNNHHLLNVEKDQKAMVNNVSINGFNQAITNHGDLTAKDCKYSYGQSIYSDEDSALRLYNSIFTEESRFNIGKNVTVDMRNCTVADVKSETYEDYINWGAYGINPKDCEKGTLSLHVADVNDLKNVANFVWNKENTKNYDIVKIVFDNDDTYKIDSWFEQNLLHPQCKKLIIEGSGAKIQLNNFDNENKYQYRNEYHFLTVDKGISVFMTHLTVQYFNTAVVNYGDFKSDRCAFNDNKLEYWICEDRGGAIKNYGDAEIQNCHFINNYAKIGGAIYTKECAHLTLKNNYYDGNDGYGDNDKSVNLGYNNVFCENQKAYDNVRAYGDEHYYVYKPIHYY